MKTGLGRRENHRRVIEKKQFFLHPLAEFAERGQFLGLSFRALLPVAPADFLFARLADFGLEQIPFVDDDDAGFAVLDDDVGDFFVLLGDARFGVQHQNRDVAARDGVLGALDAEKFNRIVHAPRLPHAGGVNQNVFLPHAVGLDLERHVNRVARRAGNRRDDDALGLRERVDDGGFADVRPADDGEFQGDA